MIAEPIQEIKTKANPIQAGQIPERESIMYSVSQNINLMVVLHCCGCPILSGGKDTFKFCDNLMFCNSHIAYFCNMSKLAVNPLQLSTEINCKSVMFDVDPACTLIPIL